MAKKLKTIKKDKKKLVVIDPLYQSIWFSKLLNKFMLHGKKHIMDKIFYNSFFSLKQKFHIKPLKFLFYILIKFKQTVGFLIRTYPYKRKPRDPMNIPVPLDSRRQYILALKWLTQHIKKEIYFTLKDRLIKILTEILEKKRSALTKHRNTYFITIRKNRFNTRFRWK